MQALLSSVDIFQGLPPNLIERLAAQGQRRRFRRGDRLMCPGDVARCLQVIVAGWVCVARVHPDLDEAMILVECGPGDVVGELGVLDGEPRPDTVIALQDTETVELSAATLAQVLLAFPEDAAPLLPVLSRRLHTAADLARTYRPRIGKEAPP